MKVFPWRTRSQRRAAVADARERAAEAQERAAEARERAEETEALKKDLQRMAADNHFALAIHNLITGRTDN